MADEARNSASEREEVPLSKAALYLLEECRMVLPGIQALLGFQLVVVFNPRFAELLSPIEQRLHLAAIFLLTIAIALIMTPAAYHRQTGARQVTSSFLRLAGRLLLTAMAPLALSLCLEIYLVGQVIVPGAFLLPLAGGLLLLLVALWFVFPRLGRSRRG